MIAAWRKLRLASPSYRRTPAWLLDEKNFCIALGIWWRDAGRPAVVDGPEPPDFMLSNTYQAARWREAWDLRVALDAAAGIVGSPGKISSAAS